MERKEGKNRSFNLEERLVNFAVLIEKIVEALPQTRSGIYIAGQLIRSGMSPALNYGEAQSAESRNDFIHKIKIVLKELRETNISLQIIQKTDLIKTPDKILPALNECNQLISIFVKSVETAQDNKNKLK